MILPREVKTKNKIRDSKIINLWLEGETQLELGRMFGVTEDAIYSIIRKNRPAMKLDKESEKFYRIHELKMQLRKSKDSKKDKLDILEALRTECEGDWNNQLGIVNNIVYVIHGERAQKEINVNREQDRITS